ncbi:Malate-2H(+)/Na(+)-lactate antiporter, partial [Haemophilus influenzae]
TLKV